MQQQDVKYQGVPVSFDGQTFVIPSLSVRQFQTHYDVLASPAPANDRESVIERFNVIVPVIGAAVRRNYPHITDDYLFEHLDLRTFSLALKAVQNASGLVEAAPGEART